MHKNINLICLTPYANSHIIQELSAILKINAEYLLLLTGNLTPVNLYCYGMEYFYIPAIKKEIKMINESGVASIKNTARVVLATVIAFILMVCIFTVTAFAGVTGLALGGVDHDCSFVPMPLGGW